MSCDEALTDQEIADLAFNVRAVSEWAEGGPADSAIMGNGRIVPSPSKLIADARLFKPADPYNPATQYTDATAPVIESDIVYAPVPSLLPIGPEAFDPAKWYILQGATDSQIIELTREKSLANELARPAVLADLGSAYSTFEYNTGTGIGGNKYTLVASGTGTPDGGSFLDKTDGSGFQLQGIFSDGVAKMTQFSPPGSATIAEAQALVDFIGISFLDGLIDDDIAISAPIVIGKSLRITSPVKDKGVRPTITSNAGQSGIEVTKVFVGGVDENIVNVDLEGFKVIDAALTKAVGTVGILYDRVNVGGVIRNVEVRGYEKGINLKGVIGGEVHDVFCSKNKYGLYTESNNDGGLPAFDCTNTNFYGGVYNANETGIFLGPITQGMTFYGTNTERNTVAGMEIAATPPASGAIAFFGGWFEANPIAILFTTKPKSVQFDGVNFFDNAELWDNAGSGVVTATFERCKIESSNINLDIFQGRFVDNDVFNSTFTATSPAAYQIEEWRGTSVLVDDGNTLFTTRSMGSGRYAVEASGAPGSTALNDGSTWTDFGTAIKYVRVGSVWQRIDSFIENNRTVDFTSISAGGTATFGPVTVTGAAVGDFVEVIPSGDMQGIVFQVFVSGVNAVSGTLYNFTAGSIDLPEITYRIKVQKA